MFFSTIFLLIMFLMLKYVLAWIVYVNKIDSRLGDSTWRWSYDYQVIGERDFSDLDDKEFVRLRRKKNKLVTIMYSIFLIMFIFFISWLSKFLILVLNQFLFVFYFLSKEKKQSPHKLKKKFEKKVVA